MSNHKRLKKKKKRNGRVNIYRGHSANTTAFRFLPLHPRAATTTPVGTLQPAAVVCLRRPVIGPVARAGLLRLRRRRHTESSRNQRTSQGRVGSQGTPLTFPAHANGTRYVETLLPKKPSTTLQCPVFKSPTQKTI